MITDEMKPYIELMKKPVVNAVSITTMKYDSIVISQTLKMFLSLIGPVVEQMNVNREVNELYWCPMNNLFIFWKTNEDMTFTLTIIWFNIADAKSNNTVMRGE